MSETWLLIRKDLRLHGRSLVTFHLVLGAAALAAFQWMRQSSGVSLGLVGNLNLIGAVVWSEWLISREKTKGSFAWLRTLPITQRSLCRSKFLLAGLSTTSLFAVTAPTLLTTDLSPEHWARLPLVYGGTLLFGAVTIASRWRFRQKVGQLLPFALFLPPLVLIELLRRAPRGAPVDALWSTGSGSVGLLIVFAVGYTAAYMSTSRWLQQAETRELLE